MKSRIIITDEIITDALASGKTVTDVMTARYEGEIADRIKADERYAGHNAFDFAMLDAGFSTRSVINDLYTTSDNEWLFPVFVDRKLRESVADMNMLPYIVGNTDTVSSLSVRGAKLNMDEDNKDAAKMKRVAEGTDIPTATIKLAEFAISLFKRGRAVEASYETIMFQTFDQFGRTLEMIANDVSHQQLGDAIKVLIEGDGNKNPAAVHTMTGTDLTSAELVKFAIAFWRKSKFPLTTLITGDGEFYEKLLLTTFNVNEINGMIAGARFNFPQAQLADFTVIYDERVPTGGSNKEQLIGLNRNYALTKYIAAGSQIREYNKNIRNQTNLGTISEIAGFAKLNDDATMILRAK